jgi:hypothetical protein
MHSCEMPRERLNGGASNAGMLDLATGSLEVDTLVRRVESA